MLFLSLLEHSSLVIVSVEKLGVVEKTDIVDNGVKEGNEVPVKKNAKAV